MVRFVDEPAATAQRAQPVELDPTMLSVSREQDASRGLRALLALLPLMTAPRPSEQLLAEMIPLLGEIVPTASAFLVLAVGADGSMTTLASQVGLHSFAPSRTLIREALRTGQAVSHLWQRDVGPGTVAGPTMVEGVSWALAAPIVAGDRSFVLYVIGSELDSEEGKVTPGELDRAVLAMVTRVIAGLMAQRSGGPDPLTGLPGRAEFLSQARGRLPATLILMRLAGLKEINGKHGYAVGDQALREAGRRWASFWGTEAVTGRLSGAVFGALVPDSAAGRAEELRQKMAANPLPVGSESVPMEIRMGAAGGDPELERLLWRAEQAL
jgi:GGDEF domain-containing protein